MIENINAAGYETKPWWPYVMNLQKQIDEGGGGGGGSTATLRIDQDVQTQSLTCNATKEEVAETANASALNLEMYSGGALVSSMVFKDVQPSYSPESGELVFIDYFSRKTTIASTSCQENIDNLFISMADPDTPGYVQLGASIRFTSSGSSYTAPMKMSIAFPNF